MQGFVSGDVSENGSTGSVGGKEKVTHSEIMNIKCSISIIYNFSTKLRYE